MLTVSLVCQTNTPLECVTQWICSDTAKILEDHQIKTYMPYGGEKVFFQKEEIKSLKDFGEPGTMSPCAYTLSRSATETDLLLLLVVCLPSSGNINGIQAANVT